MRSWAGTAMARTSDLPDTLAVVLDGAVAGTLTRGPNATLRFDYDESHQANPEATPVSLSMPRAVRTHQDGRGRRVVTDFLWGLLPENDAVLERWARHYQVSISSPFALLSTRVGEDCAGGVAFCSPDDLPRLLDRPGHVDWLTDSEVAGRIRELRRDQTAWLGRTFAGQFSLAGAQAKTALLYRDGRWGVPSGGSATTHILKPAVAGLDDHDLNEHLCLAAATRVGLTAAHSWVGTFEDQSAIVVERYDRIVDGGLVVRVHQEDVCQALGIAPAAKYQRDGGPSPADIAGLLRRWVAPAAAGDSAVASFADALIWNWIIAGTDAHAKNYSVLLSGPQVRLAPLYDVASALPYGAHERNLRFAMKIGGDYDVYPRFNRWPALAKELGLDPDRLVDRVRVLAAATPDALSAAAAVPAVKALARPLPAKLVDLVAERARRCGALVLANLA
jgi:serine/threonine-protein kinase HipA